MTVTVFGYQRKTVVVIKKFSLIAIGQDLRHIGKAVCKPCLYILGGDVMAAALDAVFDAAQAFFRSIQADIIQADKVTGLLGAAGAFLPDSRAKFAMLFVPLALAVIVPTVFSWKIYREEQEK